MTDEGLSEDGQALLMALVIVGVIIGLLWWGPI